MQRRGLAELRRRRSQTVQAERARAAVPASVLGRTTCIRLRSTRSRAWVWSTSWVCGAPSTLIIADRRSYRT